MDFLSNKCPKCRKGAIFEKLVVMNKSCSNCSYIFEREEGYFVGAMFLDTMFLPISTIPTIVIFAYNEQIKTGAIVAGLQMLFLSPLIFRLSRLLWIQMGYKLDPPKE